MAENSKIEWTHHTANLWWGCTNVHEGCDNCYAEVFANRYGVKWGNDAARREVKGVWGSLLGMQAKSAAKNEIHRVFVGSMMDIFEKPMKLISQTGNELPYNTEDLRRKFFTEIVPNSPNLMFLLLTKRPSNINKHIPSFWKLEPPKNVMFGTSVVNQKTANDLIPQLARVKGKRFISCEPQLDKISLLDYAKIGDTINGRLIDWVDWVIQGGESGNKKRPFNLEWAYEMRDDCNALNTPYFFKQIDKIQEIPSDLLIREFPKSL